MTDALRLASMESDRFNREEAKEREEMLAYYLDNISSKPSQNEAAEWLWELKNDRDHYRRECVRLREQANAAMSLYHDAVDHPEEK